MPHRIKHVHRRLVLLRMMLRVRELITVAYIGTDRPGSAADDVALIIGVFIGQAEGRPMTAAKLADYIGMPRPTVIRKLRALACRGLIEMDDGCVRLPVAALNDPRVLAACDAAVEAVQRAAADLSKTDTKPLSRTG
jgi:CRP-like cAMP-binding protein